MNCPRCGTLMEGGICPECGFPITARKRGRNIFCNRRSAKSGISLLLLLLTMMFLCACSADVKLKKEEASKKNDSVVTRKYLLQISDDITENEMDNIKTIIQKRTEYYTNQGVVEQYHDEKLDREVVEITMPKDLDVDYDELFDNLTMTGKMEFREHFGEENESVVLSGRDIESATSVIYNDVVVNYCINLKFTEEGTKKFAKATEENVGNQITILYDGKVLSSPTVVAAITDGVAQISNMESREAADILAWNITAGFLPCNLVQIEK